MSIGLVEFLSSLPGNPALIIISLLTIGTIFVNGWTDAPNAIATCVSTRAMKAKNAIIMAAVFNFLGVVIMSLINANVAATIYKMVDFHGDAYQALVALAAALFAIVVWATAAWYFGIPTSESPPLIAGISGAAIAMQGGLDGINGSEWMKVVYGLGLSTVLGFGMGWLVVKAVSLIFKRTDRTKSAEIFKKCQIGAGAALAFMHGAQDGQKFIGVFMLGIALVGGVLTNNFQIPFWLMVLCSVVMGVGTSIGGYRIIKTVGMNMVKLEPFQGFSADLAGSICLLLASIFGLPVSTTHTKTTSIMGVGAAKRLSSVNWGVVKDMALAWILTFPGCGLLGYAMAKVFFVIF